MSLVNRKTPKVLKANPPDKTASIPDSEKRRRRVVSTVLKFNLQLAYLKENGTSVVWGEATLEVEIEILFLSFSVSVKCRREFGGSEGDPKFIELIRDQATWTEYCQALHFGSMDGILSDEN